jgi:NADH-quinone oxidoreductase subunit F
VPIVSVALRLAEFYRHESCGKCVPCREGTNWTVKMLERIDRGEATPIDLDVMESIQQNIIGNCLCLLGDSMAMPISSMIKHFRPEFEEYIAVRREIAERVAGMARVGHEPGDEVDLVGVASDAPAAEQHPQEARIEEQAPRPGDEAP